MESNQAREGEPGPKRVVQIANEQDALPVDEERVRRAVTAVLAGEGVPDGQISVAVVDDPTIQRLNEQHLGHDGPTDVISFPFERREGYLEGEIVVSADTARHAAALLGWPAEDELLLYVVHGTLHLVGLDDLDEAGRREMRRREKHYLAQFGLVPPWD